MAKTSLEKFKLYFEYNKPLRHIKQDIEARTI